MSVRVEAVFRALHDHAREEIAKSYHADCCIDATAIVLDVLDYASVNGRALCTKANIRNKAALAFIEKHDGPALVTDPPEKLAEWENVKAKWIGIGYETHQEGGYRGHLVTIAKYHEQDVLIDLTLNQADRPDYGIIVPAIIAEATPEFITGSKSLNLSLNDEFHVWYNAEVSRDDFIDTPAWKHTKQRQPTVRAIIRHAKEIERLMT